MCKKALKDRSKKKQTFAWNWSSATRNDLEYGFRELKSEDIAMWYDIEEDILHVLVLTDTQWKYNVYKYAVNKLFQYLTVKVLYAC